MKVIRMIVFAALTGLFAAQVVAVAQDVKPARTVLRTVPKAAPPVVVKRKPVAPVVKKATRPKVQAQKPFSLAGPVDMLEVDIGRQRLMVWDNQKVVETVRISTGMDGYDTPTGRFRVIAKAVNGWSRKWEVVMPWMLVFKGNYTFHQITHRRGSNQLIGGHQLGTRASHGCIRLPYGVAETLYRKTSVGTPVWIHY